jgi:hypothetical protein
MLVIRIHAKNLLEITGENLNWLYEAWAKNRYLFAVLQEFWHYEA